ncbi:hypothetical protein [Dokdonella soli]|uniref:Uncharacterized protein n=1 Tax=Dokdonella soli TaxID=529810 RepID=A0ABP3TWK6_9GAMM
MPRLQASFFDPGDGCTYALTLSVDDAQRILDLADQPVLTVTLLPSIDGQAHRSDAQLVVTHRSGSGGTPSIYTDYRVACAQLSDALDARDFLDDSDT